MAEVFVFVGGRSQILMNARLGTEDNGQIVLREVRKTHSTAEHEMVPEADSEVVLTVCCSSVCFNSCVCLI